MSLLLSAAVAARAQIANGRRGDGRRPRRDAVRSFRCVCAHDGRVFARLAAAAADAADVERRVSQRRHRRRQRGHDVVVKAPHRVCGGWLSL